jgi:hypothetical protein
VVDLEVEAGGSVPHPGYSAPYRAADLRSYDTPPFCRACIQQPDKVLQTPNVIGESSLHRWRDAQRLMHTARVVVNEVLLRIFAGL